jgi:hypothetical protein
MARAPKKPNLRWMEVVLSAAEDVRKDRRLTKTAIARNLDMPWTANDAEKHTHKANTPALKELWPKVANETLERTGDEGRSIREANAVVGRQRDAIS